MTCSICYETIRPGEGATADDSGGVCHNDCRWRSARAADSLYAGNAFERQQQRDALGDDEHGRKSW